MKKTCLFGFVLATLLLAVSCSNGSDDPVSNNSGSDSKASGEYAIETDLVTDAVYKSSGDLSEYMTKALTAAYITPSSTPPTDDGIPTVFIASKGDFNTLNSEDCLLAVRTCLAGQTFIMDSPTVSDVLGLALNIVAALKDNEYYSDMCDVSPYSITNIFEQFPEEDFTNPDAKLFEAIAMRGSQVYFVHDIDEVLTYDLVTGSVSSETVQTTETVPEDDCDEKETITVAAKDYDYSKIISESVSDFADWINSCGHTSARSAIDDAKKAQSFVHSFTAKFTSDSDHYDGRYNGKTESVKLYIDVWTACDIDNKKDYYLVRTSAVCNNQELGYANQWDNGKYVGPYFKYCEITSKLGNGYASLKSNDCKPQTSTGSSSFTSGESFSFGGNVGFNASGPTGGISTGYSKSESRTQSIPDIDIGLSVSNNQAVWTFTAPDVNPYWSGLYTKCDGAKGIQSKTAIFDTYSVYTMDSCNYWNGTVPITTTGKVDIAMMTGWLSGFCNGTLNWKHPGYWTSHTWTDRIQKPSNSYCNYIMYFEAPDGTTPERKELLNNILKTYVPDWGSSVRYYGWCDTAKCSPSATNGTLDAIAKKHFSAPKKTIQTNQKVLKDRGFAGKFKFILRNAETGKDISSFDLTF